MQPRRALKPKTGKPRSALPSSDLQLSDHAVPPTGKLVASLPELRLRVVPGALAACGLCQVLAVATNSIAGPHYSVLASALVNIRIEFQSSAATGASFRFLRAIV
jgi:hypothetical protein